MYITKNNVLKARKVLWQSEKGSPDLYNGDYDQYMADKNMAFEKGLLEIEIDCDGRYIVCTNAFINFMDQWELWDINPS